jgi:hypothetical protein
MKIGFVSLVEAYAGQRPQASMQIGMRPAGRHMIQEAVDFVAGRTGSTAQESDEAWDGSWGQSGGSDDCYNCTTARRDTRIGGGCG